MPSHRLITVDAMRRMDAAAIAAGVPGIELMRRAGAAVAARAAAMVAAPSRILVLCGPGNNGGDGLVAARLLERNGYAVDLVCTVPVDSLTGDAALAAAEWQGVVLTEADPAGAALVIDALFGAGLSRDLDGAAKTLVERVAATDVPVLAVDIPSGIDGDTGALRGVALRARETVTFVALKPGHLLQPGRDHCGHLHVADIGIGDPALEQGLAGTPRVWRNGPDLWGHDFPRLDAVSHKYTRGHVLALSGPAFKTGAIRLAARAALRVGAGLVTIASPTAAMPENAAHLTAIMLTPCETADDLDDLLVDERLNVILAGPGMGSGEATRERVAVAAGIGRSLVLDADALTSFKGHVDQLASLIADGGGQAVLTPHAGEFGRLFAVTDAVDPKASKLERAQRAASLAGAVVVLKGADTIVAAPDGRAAINDHATPYLGTAGSGDVLAGLVAGLLAQGMPPFEAACAAVWLHGDAGLRHGPGLIAEDLPEMMPKVLAGLL
ncbi:bifunctional ADP-dependent NAD(P)H-hydrate dehydratase/NAD(P)H-hydrate epimerase [Methylobacterium sp. Leaf85]|uniref:bifunctional ADP-dependent NAD(P)H-hydrate dehydratase/NAD(P)H-hydrate epimerase n=1 Tax=Methylobacterium sp. Leaf85 TaxID=1736241 RepID=UPI0006F783F9|nr:bifunctional ADP-dependent NAD(P)H-hydrate dehydratase/NAD(P)H-hydrate epimerase [Methylobacterium sp. Leaf85]KQO46008.1 NAD(P)H-hydrate epimerase [Methylobacterium sp. Leaf85]